MWGLLIFTPRIYTSDNVGKLKEKKAEKINNISKIKSDSFISSKQ